MNIFSAILFFSTVKMWKYSSILCIFSQKLFKNIQQQNKIQF